MVRLSTTTLSTPCADLPPSASPRYGSTLRPPNGDLLQKVGGLFNVTPEALEDCTNVESTHAMNLEIVTSNGRLDEDFRQDVEQRLHNGLLRFENRIVRATVSFLDLSGPYGAEQQ